MHGCKVFFNNTLEWKSVFAVFTNSTNVQRIAMTLLRNNLYKCDISDEFDDVYFTNEEGACTVHTFFNCLCCAFEPNGHTFSNIICLHLYEGISKADTNTTDIHFDFINGLEKAVHIWTPQNYDKNDNTKKYGVVYMFDGQNLFNENSTSCGSWNVPQIMNMRGDYIVVGIDNGDKYRNSQLTPNIGKTKEIYNAIFSNGTGVFTAQLVVNKIIPYVNKNYNVFTDKEHTVVCGSSSGGLESFYIGMTYSNVFGLIGSLSPAFVIYDDSVWNRFLKGVDINNAPRLYLYTGANDIFEEELYPQIEHMKVLLDNNGYDAAKMVYECRKYNYHNEACWSGVFAKFVSLLK